MKKDKQKALELLKKKINGEIIISYQQIAEKTGYERKQINRFLNQIEKKDIDELLIHGLTGKNSNNSVPDQEIEYIKEFKNQYPNISISQFRDIYHEDVIWNNEKEEDVKKYNLKVRSKSFFQNLYKNEGWKSPIKHKHFKYKKDAHSLREPIPRTGILIMTDGTPYDWFGTGELYSLHSTLDDATGKLCSGWFTKNECQFGYLKAFEMLFEKYGIPQAIYDDILNNTIKVFKNNNLYNTRIIEGQRINMEKKKLKEIEEQKKLERLFREKDERLKARAKRS